MTIFCISSTGNPASTIFSKLNFSSNKPTSILGICLSDTSFSCDWSKVVTDACIETPSLVTWEVSPWSLRGILEIISRLPAPFFSFFLLPLAAAAAPLVSASTFAFAFFEYAELSFSVIFALGFFVFEYGGNDEVVTEEVDGTTGSELDAWIDIPVSWPGTYSLRSLPRPVSIGILFNTTLQITLSATVSQSGNFPEVELLPTAGICSITGTADALCGFSCG